MWLFFSRDTAPTDVSTLSLHDALPICRGRRGNPDQIVFLHGDFSRGGVDRKSTRLNSSHVAISYAVFCLKKKIDIHLFRRCALPLLHELELIVYYTLQL